MKKMVFIKRYLSEENGATAVEFAIISVLFMMFLFGIIEAGRIFWTLNALQYAVEQTARYALVNADATTTELEEVATENMEGIRADTANLTVAISTTTISTIDFLQVDGSYTFDLWVPLLPDSMDNMTLTASTRQPIP